MLTACHWVALPARRGASEDWPVRPPIAHLLRLFQAGPGACYRRGGAPRLGRGHGLSADPGQLNPAALRMLLLVDADRPEPVCNGARELALFLTPEPQAEIRSDTSQILEENIPLLKGKVTEMRGVYTKVDQLEAFVKMVGQHLTFLEAHVLQAERAQGAFSQTLKKWLGSAGLPSFRTNPLAPAPPPYELPKLYRTEDYFPVDSAEVPHQPQSSQRRL
ncbi:breast carcinoma-amplified sequence 4 isoform X2 [Erinaceus europaeus]|uniref:Breast carcinoma-amplified sequence 4 isoform X2 n=1 Tax=Erinaceus europaeus TaxID=9365 RepID=A0ABM3YC70_ERIEU|nr:breast carcinoma-amplified sequence 4 isoform X2 [Erinaceus europaeus]